MIKKPNFLFILVDEMRYPPIYETAELKKWRKENLRSQELLKMYGMEFKRHYVGSTACTPSRTTLFTGQYPSLHGVSQTSGAAKTSFDPDMFWLDENTVPTLGTWLTAGGYKTYYRGKWHVSEEDILIPTTHDSLASYDATTGVPNPYVTELYLKANRLGKYGFSGVVGPEPHGTDAYNSGSSAPAGIGGRDVVYSQQIINVLSDLESSSSDKPWFVVASFVNPHDITLYGNLTRISPNFNFVIDPSLPIIPPAPTANENLSTKPVAQQSYKDVYQQAFQPTTDTEEYRKFYYSLQKQVDDEIYKVLQTIINSPMYKDTIIVFTSDHGDEVGAHGLFQKWHNFYEESVHVPLIFHNPVLFSQYKSSKELTSHVDLVPTLLGLAGIDINNIKTNVMKTHSEVHHLVGKSLCLDSKKRNYCPGDRYNEPLYFMTEDEPTSGLNQTTFTGKPYHAVIQPNNVESIITYLRNHEKHLYKYSRYYDPNSLAEEFEMYNLTADPLETKNLVVEKFSTPKTKIIRIFLQAVLLEQRAKKRLVPRTLQPVTNF